MELSRVHNLGSRTKDSDGTRFVFQHSAPGGEIGGLTRRETLPPPVVEPDRQSLSIVVLGDFNPSIFQPLWFSTNDLIPQVEAENAEILLIQKQVAAFSMGKINVQVDGSRLGLTTDEPSQEPIIRDLALGTLSLLEHTPLRAIGLNLDMVFAMPSEEAWHALGDRLAPKHPWRQILENPEMRQVVVEGRRPDCPADRISVRVQPTGNKLVLLAMNQHYQLETDERSEGRERHVEAIRVLRDDWTSFTSFARGAAPKLLEFGQHIEGA
jgi:hypothetical protein